MAQTRPCLTAAAEVPRQAQTQTATTELALRVEQPQLTEGPVAMAEQAWGLLELLVVLRAVEAAVLVRWLMVLMVQTDEFG